MDEAGVAADINALVVGMIGMFFLTLVIVLFVVVYQRKLLRQERKHKQAEEAHQLELLQATIESQEVERDRIGRELHDGVGVMLSTTRLYVRYWQEEDEEGKVIASQKIDQLLGDTVESVRRVSADLRPVVLETLGLAEAIADLAHKLEETGELKVNVNTAYDYRLAQQDELNIYRVVQELLTNTIRHAKATEAALEMSSLPHRFFLSYQDNGRGLPENGDTPKGLGLKNMESRINALNGHFTIESPSRGGIQVTIDINKR
ncbi:MAG: sensor histidine kinase [Roseivirga sp.]|nr:sensor histidine kinase [Roseivirga sp.]